jgi:hypothetical protein
MNTNRALNAPTRLAYAFIGLLGGDAALLLFLVQNAFRARQIPVAAEMFVFYASFSLVGWLLVGLPIAVFFPTRSITRLSWPLTLLVGAALGPLALLVIFALLGHGHVEFPGTFRGTGWLWAFSILVSTVSFVLYTALLKEKSPSAT